MSESVNELAIGYMAACMICAGDNEYEQVPLEGWRFSIDDPGISDIMTNIKCTVRPEEITHDMVSYLSRTCINTNKSEDKALKVISTTDRQHMYNILNKWNAVTDFSPTAGWRNTILTACSLNIQLGWDWASPSTNLTSLYSGKAIQIDCCESIRLHTNLYGDFVLSYLIPTKNNNYIGFRYTLPSTSESTFSNIIKLSSSWRNYTVCANHKFKGVRLPCFSKKITKKSIATFNKARVYTTPVECIWVDTELSISKFGHNLSTKMLPQNNNIMRICPDENDSDYLEFYERTSTGSPSNFNICVEVYYAPSDGSFSDTDTIYSSMINSEDIAIT